MEAIIIHPRNKEQLSALKIIFKEMKIPFEKAQKEESPYDPEFVKKIKQGDKDRKAGRYTTYTLKELDELCK